MVSRDATGMTSFRLYLPHAAKVELAGSFTNWRENKLLMRRSHPGNWTIELDLAPGEHQFAYLVDGHLWIADYAAGGVKLTPHGGWVSTLTIPPALATTTPRDTVAA
jgi:1,4-alpha-glucan branching enzyme